ncbi:MAG: hypothetical protein IIA60_08345 [Candidatus Marinimicrobia bacterium]|nr:hypothetical protein [Candidatus Neomarinimicrobiota bacterium]
MVIKYLMIIVVAYGFVEFLVWIRGAFPSSDEGSSAHTTRESTTAESATEKPTTKDLGKDADRKSRAEDDGSGHSKNENVFMRDGPVWDIQFQGEDARVPNSVGMRRIALLLSLPGTHISALKIMKMEPARSANIDPSVLEEEQGENISAVDPETGEVLEMSGVSVDNLTKPPVEIVDQKTIDDVREKIRDLHDKREFSSDVQEQEMLNKELAACNKYLVAVTDNEGKPRLSSSDLKNASDAVRGSIKEAIIEIGKKLPNLAAHLDQAFKKYGQAPIYSPNPPVKWIVL